MLDLCDGVPDSSYIARSIATAVRKAGCVYSGDISQHVRRSMYDSCLLNLTLLIFFEVRAALALFAPSSHMTSRRKVASNFSSTAVTLASCRRLPPTSTPPHNNNNKSLPTYQRRTCDICATPLQSPRLRDTRVQISCLNPSNPYNHARGQSERVHKFCPAPASSYTTL